MAFTEGVQEKGTAIRMKKADLKYEAFANSYIKNGFNGTKTAKELYNPKDDNSAATIASDNLRKPKVQEKIKEAMEKAGLTHDFIAEATKRNIKQSKNYGASNSAIDIYHKLEGNYAPERRANLNINVPANLDIAMKELLQELESLNNKE